MSDNRIQIKYKDSDTWTAISGTKTLWSEYSIRTAPGRIYSRWLQPERIVFNWNGQQQNIRDTRYKAYFIEFNIRESEIENISRIQSCTDIQIIDLQAGLIFIPDLSDLSLFEVSEPTPVADTTNWKVSIIFRTEKTYIDYALRTGLDYSLIFYNADANNELKTIDNEFTTALNGAKSLVYPLKFDPIYTELDAELNTVNNNDGIEEPTKILSKRQVSTLQYDSETNSAYIKKYGTLCNVTGLNLNTVFAAGGGNATFNRFTAGTGTITWDDAFTFSFSLPQNDLSVGDVVKVGTDELLIDTLIMTGPDVSGFTIADNVADFGTTTFSYWITSVATPVTFSAMPVIYPGMKLKVGSEIVQVTEILNDEVFINPEFAADFTTSAYSISVFYKFQEVPTISSAQISENLYQNNINGITNILNYYPKA